MTDSAPARSGEVHDVGDVEAARVLLEGGVDGRGRRHDEQAEIPCELCVKGDDVVVSVAGRWPTFLP